MAAKKTGKSASKGKSKATDATPEKPKAPPRVVVIPSNPAFVDWLNANRASLLDGADVEVIQPGDVKADDKAFLKSLKKSTLIINATGINFAVAAKANLIYTFPIHVDDEGAITKVDAESKYRVTTARRKRGSGSKPKVEVTYRVTCGDASHTFTSTSLRGAKILAVQHFSPENSTETPHALMMYEGDRLASVRGLNGSWADM